MPRSLLLAVAASAALSSLAPPAAMANTEFESMDGNSDGIVSSAEHEEYASKMFDLIDTDQDDNLTVAEVDASVGNVTGHAAGPDGMDAAQKIRRRDVNGDGMISRTEYDTGAAAKFQEMDANNNGELTQQELDAGR